MIRIKGIMGDGQIVSVVSDIAMSHDKRIDAEVKAGMLCSAF